MPNSNEIKQADKPAKPYPDFPLFPHATRRWAKKIRGKLHYFGRWDDPDAALQKFLDQRDDLYAGRQPRPTSQGLTIRDLANRFLTAKKQLVETGELTQRTFDDYHKVCEKLIDHYGRGRVVEDLRSDDFDKLRAKLAKTRGPVALGNEVQRVRVVFNYAHKAGLIDKSVQYGPHFKRPSNKTLRKARQANGPRMFEAEELQQMLDAASQPLKAMILLAINCGFGNHDVGTLPKSAVDLEKGWVNYARPKTGIPRRAPLWPETIAALQESQTKRPEPKDQQLEGFFFLTKRGLPWAKDTADSPVSKECRKLLNKLGINRPRVNFYALRHTFETIGGEARDQIAVDHIMGHARDDMASQYRERISDERLQAVTDHLRQWLFGEDE